LPCAENSDLCRRYLTVPLEFMFRQKDFFAGAAKMTAQQREEEYNKIKKDYTKVIDEANEKIHIADECYG
jgi:hypothetical protein